MQLDRSSDYSNKSIVSRILFYTPFNQRSRDTESLILALRKKGHYIISLNQQDGSGFHDYLRGHGIEVHSMKIKGNSNIWYHLKHTLYFIYFCWKKRISVVFSHLESANLVAVMGQHFVPSKVFIVRHHADYFNLIRKDDIFTYKFIYRLAKRIIVVSRSAKEFMIQNEGIRDNRITHINLGYDFNLFDRPKPEAVDDIRRQINASFILITIGRFISIKRTEESILLLNKLVLHGIDAKLILLGRGEEEILLKRMVSRFSLNDRVFFKGHVSNVLEYLSVAHFLIHPSISESSCVVVKEAAFVGVPVIACMGVGDFDEYIISEENGFLVERERFVEESSAIIMRYSSDMAGLQEIGKKLFSNVFEIFSINKVAEQYHQISLR